MDDDSLPEELQDPSEELFPTNEDKNLDTAPQVEPESESTQESRFFMLVENLSQLGIADSVLRLGTHMLFIALALLVVWAMRVYYLNIQMPETPQQAAQAAVLSTPTPTYIMPDLPPLSIDGDIYQAGIPRLAQVHTIKHLAY